MNAADFLSAARNLPVGTLQDITGGRGLVVVAPHPDDESLGCGGLIAEARAVNLPVRLIVVSDGAGSHPNSRRFPADRLRAVREAETLNAASELGLEEAAIQFLRLPDRDVPTEGPMATAASDAVAAAAAEIAAGAVCVTWRHDPHCDHEACALIVEAARPKMHDAHIFSYPVWGWVLPAETEVGPPPSGFRIDVRRHATSKTAAIAAHRSQTPDLIDDDPTGFRLSAEMITHFSGPYEILLRNEPCEIPL